MEFYSQVYLLAIVHIHCVPALNALKNSLAQTDIVPSDGENGNGFRYGAMQTQHLVD